MNLTLLDKFYIASSSPKTLQQDYPNLMLIKTHTCLGVTCYVYELEEKQLIITITPFYYQSFLSYLKTGFCLLQKQQLIEVPDRSHLRMNKFFYTVASYFLEKLENTIMFHKNSINIIGMSMGGAIGLCLACLMTIKKYIINVITFGAPRIGNLALRKYLNRCKKVCVKNYALIKIIDNIKRIDPVCLFPSAKYDCYVNNELIGIFDGDFVKPASLYMDQPDTHISLKSLICNFGFDDFTLELWREIHTIKTYYENIFSLET